MIGRFLLAIIALALAACAGTPRSHVASAPSPARMVGVEQMERMARAELNADRPDSGLQIYRELLRHVPQSGAALVGAGDSALRAGHVVEALAFYTGAADIPEVATEARRGQVMAHLAAGQPVEGQGLLNTAIAEDRDLAWSWRMLARIHEQSGQWSAANAAYEAAIAADPDAAPVRNDYGAALLQQGRHAEARTQFLAALERDPSLAEAQTNLRLVYAWQGNYEQALAHAPAQERSQVLNNVGYVAMLRGDHTQAEMFLAEALRTSPVFYRKALENLNMLRARAGQ